VGRRRRRRRRREVMIEFAFRDDSCTVTTAQHQQT
jgi:hypothetical protein